uniref:EF-hand domain-containing protein n=1 Tax=Acrobeloides nanus TaxID=290746 RepID=A0A914CWQ0_9BILA
MRSLGYTPTVIETNKYLKSNGPQIDFAKFLDILHAEELKGDTLVEVIRAFKGLDSKNQGVIPAAELINLLSSFGEKMSKEEVLAVLKRMNVNNKVPIAKVIQYVSSPV